MKVIILAGGMGSRLSEETEVKPKPMVEIGGKPIIWHIMKLYSYYGFNEFIICLGYKGYLIKEYFANYFLYQSDLTIEIRNNQRNIEIHHCMAEEWRITLVDTGINTMTGGRIKRVAHYIGNETFLLTYGDGVSDVDISHLVQFHRSHGKYATVTAIQPAGKFGALEISDNNQILSFQEKPKGDGSWVNGGFFVLEPEVLDYISGDETFWEREPLENLAKNNQLIAYKHHGFWKCMDTLRDKYDLEQLWSTGKAKWKVWE